MASKEIESPTNENPSALAEALSSASRRDRQNAAAQFAQLSRTDPEAVAPFAEVIVDSLKRPEARTRWESLDALCNLVILRPDVCSGSLDVAEESLFDETNGTVRLAAMRFLCKLGSVSSSVAEDIWPLIDEALQCYHGDPEYIDMLIAVSDYAQCDLPRSVCDGLIARMQFDANSPKSGLMRRAQFIIDCASSK